MTIQASLGTARGAGSDELLRRFQVGDTAAFEDLWKRHLPELTRWTRGRLPPALRDRTSVDDLVQEAFVRSWNRLRTLEPRGPGSVFRYFSTIVRNQIRDHARESARRPHRIPLEPDDHRDDAPSPFDELLGREARERYECACVRLRPRDRRIVEAIEAGCSDDELRRQLGLSSSALRMARRRALARLAEKMSGRESRALPVAGQQVGRDPNEIRQAEDEQRARDRAADGARLLRP